MIFPALKNGKRIYIDVDGNIALETNFVGLAKLIDDRAVVYINDKFGFINSLGNLIITPQFDEVREFSEGLCAVKKENEWGFIDIYGEYIIPPKYHGTGDFDHGLASSQKKRNSDISYIDKNEKIVILDSGFPLFRNFSEGLLPCRGENKLSGFRDVNGKWEIEPQYVNTNSFSEGLAGILTEDKKKSKIQFIDKNNNIIIGPKYESTGACFSEGMASVVKELDGDYKYGCINKRGELVIPYMFDYMEEFSCGLAPVKFDSNDRFGFVNKKGDMIIEPKFDKVKSFRMGIAFVEVDYKWFYINKGGDVVWEFT